MLIKEFSDLHILSVCYLRISFVAQWKVSFQLKKQTQF